MSDTPVAPLPPSYDWGFVVGRSISAMADTIADLDRFPEARGSNGRVTFTPHTRYKKELSSPTAFVQFEVVTARIENGNLVDAQGDNGIYLIAGAYKVAFTIDSGSIPGFDILVTPDHTSWNPLDLVTAAPFVPEEGTPVTTVIIPAGASEDQVLAWRNGRLVWVNIPAEAEAAAARAESAASSASSAAAAAAASVDELVDELAPSFVWNGTSLIINGGTPVDLRGEKGGMDWTTVDLGTKNLNDATQTGVSYAQSANAGASAALNYPTPAAGSLENLPYSATNVDRIIQRYTTFYSLDVYQRSRFNGVWSAWQNIAIERDTGWRRLATTYASASRTGGTVTVKRRRDKIRMRFDNVALPDGSGPVIVVHPAELPLGFSAPAIGTIKTLGNFTGATHINYLRANAAWWWVKQEQITDPSISRSGVSLYGEIEWATDDPWPLALPGDPA